MNKFILKMSNKKQICQYFLKGNCRFGDKCHNSHDISMIDDTTNAQPAPPTFNQQKACKFFLENKCTNDKCHFFHGYCDRLQHVKTIKDHLNEINNLVNMDNVKFISSDKQSFYVRYSRNDDSHKQTISQEYKIGKLTFSSNKVICGIQKEGL